MGMLYKTNSAVISCLSVCLTNNTFSLLMSEEELKGKETLSCLLSSFLLVVIFSVSSWLTQGSNMNNVFLRMSFPSFCFQRNFWLEQKMQLLGAVGTPAYLVIDVAHLLCTASESHWMPKHSRSTWIPCSWAACALHANGAAKRQTYTVHISSVLMHAPLSQDISLRKQLLKS